MFSASLLKQVGVLGVQIRIIDGILYETSGGINFVLTTVKVGVY